MQTSHEWPQPPSTTKSSSMRRKITLETLPAVDWYKPRRYESYSDGDEELRTLEPLETACQGCGYGETMGIQSSGYGGKGKGIQISGHAGNYENLESTGYVQVQEMQNSVKGLKSSGYGNGKGFQSSGYGDGQGFDIHSNTTKISSNKEVKAKFPANLRVDHSSVVPHQPLSLNALPFSGLPKPAGKPHKARLIIPACEEKTCFETKEPVSPKVTCLGHVRIKEKQGHDTEHTHTEQKTCGDAQRHTLESKKQSVDKNVLKDGTHKGGSKRGTAEKRSCLPRRKRREDTELGILKLASSAAVPLETTETRRERAALLARTMISLLEDLRRLDMEYANYVPAVPPPNSLLLMRGLGGLNKQEVSNENAFQSAENNSTINENACTDHSSECGFPLQGISGIPLQDIKMQKIMETTAGVENSNVAAQSKYATAQKGSPLSELESNSLVQNASSFQELALWQRRAVAKLAAIDTKRPMRVQIKQPSTN